MNLKLAMTEKFEELDCNFYKNRNDDILVTREQIGTALGYVDPSRAIAKIHKRHEDRLDKFSVVTSLAAMDGKKYDTFLYSEMGIMEICRWSRQPKANDFIDFTWEVMRKILNKNYPTADYSSVLSEISSLKNEVQSIKYAAIRQQPLKQYSKWKYKTNPKIKLLAE